MEQFKSRPLVSVIIPTYKRSDTLPRAIDSVLGQTYPNIEIIVVDDNGDGTDHQKATEERLKEYIDSGKITYIKHPVNKNGSAARNTGFRVSNGEYINFLDDDDVFMPEKIEKQVKSLEQRKEYDACYCTSLIYGHKRILEWRNELEGDLTVQILKCEVNFNTSTILFRRNALIDINGWDERFKRHQDWEMIIRFFRNHQICVVLPKQVLLEKYSVDNVFSSNYQSMVDFRDFYLSEMKEDINKTGNTRQIYRCQYCDLCEGLLAHGCKRLGAKYFFKVFKYGIPKPLTWVKFFYYMVS